MPELKIKNFYKWYVIPADTECNEIYFSSSLSDVIFSTSEFFKPTKIVTSGDLKFTGSKVKVLGETEVESNGILRLDLISYETEELLVKPDGFIEVFSDSDLVVKT